MILTLRTVFAINFHIKSQFNQVSFMNDCHLMFLGPILLAIYYIWRSANWPQMDQLKNFSTIFYNPNLKGVRFIKKLPTPIFWAPNCGLFDKKEVCQSAQLGPISKFSISFHYKFLIESVCVCVGGSVL